MKKYLVTAALACALGCGKKNSADNSNIQSPSDQPLGMPKAMDGTGGPSPPAVQTLQKGSGAGKAPPTIQIKE